MSSNEEMDEDFVVRCERQWSIGCAAGVLDSGPPRPRVNPKVALRQEWAQPICIFHMPYPFRGEYLMVLRDGTELTSIRRRWNNLAAILTQQEFPDLGKANLENELSFSSERPPWRDQGIAFSST
jgi:hypothetical protein